MDTEEILRQSLNLIVTGTDAEVNEGWTKLRKLESDPLLQRQLHNHEDALREMFNLRVFNDQIFNIHEVPGVMTWFSKYLVEKPFDVNPISNDIATMLRNVEITDMNHLTAILRVLLEQKVYLSELANHFKLCEAIVTSLSAFPMPSEPQKVREFHENAIKVQAFLKILCSNSKNAESENLIFICLQTLYRIISDTKRKQEPGPALMAVLQLREPLSIPQDVRWILLESHCDVQLAQALKVLCLWLPKWHGFRLSIWIMEIIQGLERQHKYDLLMDVVKETIDVMFSALREPVTRQTVVGIILHIMKRQGRPVLLQSIMNNINSCMPLLIKEDSPSSRIYVQYIVDVLEVLKQRFPKSRTYIGLQMCCTVQPQMHAVNEMFKEPVWADHTKKFEPVIESPNLYSGKVGLSNLGNTCYMNSVLQALLMTRQFCHEVLLYQPSSKNDEQVILRKLQNLFALLSYSKRTSLAPTEILLASRPAYFLPGQQQDSSEFLCHLLDVLYEQEKSANAKENCGSNGSVTSLKSSDDKDLDDASSMDEDGGTIKCWTTEEDLTGGIALQRKTPLLDFTQGDDLAHMQQLSDSHSDSTDSGIQSVDVEESTANVPLVQRVLGGTSKITYQCAQCDTSSHNTDKFRDLQLCFPEEIQENQEISVQDLINYYLTPEKLTGENKYRCDKCTKLCDAQRIIKILQAPAHLILILKHFRYDFDSGLRTKLRHKVVYNETIQLPVSTISCTTAETYQLYAAVVHSGYNMDHGHYFTYASDSKQNWFKFNDSYVSGTTLEDLKSLKPPDTPYILFYQKCGSLDGIYEEDKPELSSLSKHLQEFVATAVDLEAQARQTEKSQQTRQQSMFSRRNENFDDENPPPSSCRGALNVPVNRFLY